MNLGFTLFMHLIFRFYADGDMGDTEISSGIPRTLHATYAPETEAARSKKVRAEKIVIQVRAHNSRTETFLLLLSSDFSLK